MQEGKSAAELAELSAAAEAQDDVYRASQFLYASQVAAGKIDPKSTDISASVCRRLSLRLRRSVCQGWHL